MRTEKYNPEDYGDDLGSALRYNGYSNELQEVDVIVAEVCGENDGYNWHWILQMKDGTFRYATGGCDYTGWDCQSSASISEPRKTVMQAIKDSPIKEEYGSRIIRSTLTKQVNGTVPFAIYEE